LRDTLKLPAAFCCIFGGLPPVDLLCTPRWVARAKLSLPVMSVEPTVSPSL
jgi:hypothetical protein